ncbi:MAG: hypothetical protein CW338_08055 [Clostridiales bacterium]|nr:hypothetical protein [Clostridiales bacterium]
MKARILTASGLILAFAVALYFGGVICSVLMVLCLCLSMYEVYKALNNAGHRCISWPAWLCMVISVPLFMLVRPSVSLIITISVGAVMVITTFDMIRSEPKLEDIGASILPLMMVTLPGMCMLGIVQNSVRDAAGDDIGRSLQISLLLMSYGIPLLGDTFAYFIGSRFGKTKLCPQISPNKTIAGAVAGLIGSIVFALIIFAVFRWIPGCEPARKPFWHYIALGLIAGLAGQAGDLFASMVKRHCGIKDYSNIFPGHGGMMDRLDSVYWATVIVYVYLNWIRL